MKKLAIVISCLILAVLVSADDLRISGNAVVTAGGGLLKAPWTPYNNVDLVAWWDASDLDTITELAGFVSQWDDKSTNNNHLAQGFGFRQPESGAYTINGRNALRFDGVNDTIRNTAMVNVKATKDIYIVAKNEGVTSLYLYDWDNNGNVGVSRGTSTGFRHELSNDANQNPGSASATFTANTTNQFAYRHDGTIMQHFKDGTQSGADRSGAPNPVTLTKLAIGSNAAGQLPFYLGSVGEIIICGYQTDAIRQKIEGYLAWKWGIAGQLPVSHPYKNQKP